MSINEAQRESEHRVYGPVGPTRARYRAVDTNEGETLIYDVDRQEGWIQSDLAVRQSP